jgi:outer membrane protein OmpA-like peptidoglycan-associated protein
MILILVLCLAATAALAQDTTAVCPHRQIRQSCECGCYSRPVNDYDGLNSLRARLANPTWNGSIPNIGTGLKMEDGRIMPLTSSSERKAAESPETSSGSYAGENAVTKNPFLEEMGRGEVPVGAPVYVFFRLAGSYITDSPQLLNIQSVARLAVAENLRVRITGAADSATGSTDKNAALSISRAQHVAKLMRERGVPEENIEVLSEGGTAEYSPVEANRNCRIELFIR